MKTPALAFGSALLLAACAAQAAGLKTPEAQAQYHVMVGEMAALRQQPELAAQVLSQETGKREDALALMQQLRDKAPERPGAAYAQSLLALRFGALDVAEKAAREALKLKPESRETLLLLTGVLVKKGDLAGS